MIRGEPLALMNGAERESFCAWLLKLAGKRRGSIADHLRKSAHELAGGHNG